MSVRAEINTTFDGYVNVCLIGEGVDKLTDGEIAVAVNNALLARKIVSDRDGQGIDVT